MFLTKALLHFYALVGLPWGAAYFQCNALAR